jgi:hypothetical protein
MPYKLQGLGHWYYVVNEATGKKMSGHPLPKERALSQMRALYVAEAKKRMK